MYLLQLHRQDMYDSHRLQCALTHLNMLLIKNSDIHKPH